MQLRKETGTTEKNVATKKGSCAPNAPQNYILRGAGIQRVDRMHAFISLRGIPGFHSLRDLDMAAYISLIGVAADLPSSLYAFTPDTTVKEASPTNVICQKLVSFASALLERRTFYWTTDPNS